MQRLKIEYAAKIFDRIEDFYRALPRLLRQPRPIMQDRANSGLRLGGGSDKTEAVFRWKVSFCAGLLGNHRGAQRKKSRSAIANPAGAPRHVNALDRCKFGKRTGQAAAIRLRRPRNSVGIDDLPAELA